MPRKIEPFYNWCKDKRGNAARLARFLAVTPGEISDWIHGRRDIPALYCHRIEIFTGIKKRALRPDDFHLWGWE